jgi:serine/threonine protein kinase
MADGSRYFHQYLMLKSQRTVLSRCRAKLVSERLPAEHRPLGSSIAASISAFAKCNLLDLRSNADELLSSVRAQLSDPNLPRSIESTLLLCLKCSMTILRGISIGRETESLPPTSPRHTCGAPDPEKLSDGSLLVCRICDEYVHAVDFERHSFCCGAAYRSESRLAAIGADLRRLQDRLANFLITPWVSDEKTMVEQTLPIFHGYLLLDQLLSRTLPQSEALAASEFVEAAMTILLAQFSGSEFAPLFFEVKTAVIEKRRAASATWEAQRVLETTRVSGSGHAISLALISIADFAFIKPISAGAFARVFLAQKTTTGDIYAIKVLPKTEVVQKNQVQRVLLERDILLGFSSPHIVNFYYSIIGTHNLYLVMEYLPGGDLYSLLHNLGALDEDHCRTYMYEIAQAVSYLHSMGIIHRDLKPDNVLVSRQGHLKLTDFGLSYHGIMDRQAKDSDIADAASLVGTPDYMAPEIVLRLSHGQAVDWWALGVMMFEFLFGVPPFHAETETAIYANIVRGRLEFPADAEEISPAGIDIITKLLELNPAARLGANGSDQVLTHPWFERSARGSGDVAFVPELTDPHDTAYFESRYEFVQEANGDILEDVAIARADKASGKKRRPSGLDPGMQQFQSLSVLQLEGANQEALEAAGRKLGRASNTASLSALSGRPGPGRFSGGTDDALIAEMRKSYREQIRPLFE